MSSVPCWIQILNASPPGILITMLISLLWKPFSLFPSNTFHSVPICFIELICTPEILSFCNLFVMLVPFAILASFSCCVQNWLSVLRQKCFHSHLSSVVQRSNATHTKVTHQMELRLLLFFPTWCGSTQDHPAGQRPIPNFQFADTYPSLGGCFSVHFFTTTNLGFVLHNLFRQFLYVWPSSAYPIPDVPAIATNFLPRSVAHFSFSHLFFLSVKL